MITRLDERVLWRVASGFSKTTGISGLSWVGPGKPNLPLGLRGKAGGGARAALAFPLDLGARPLCRRLRGRGCANCQSLAQAELFVRQRERPGLHSQAVAWPPRLSAGRRGSGSHLKGNGQPLGTHHRTGSTEFTPGWARQHHSQRDPPFVPSKRLPDWASLDLSPSVDSCGCGLGPSPVRLG